MADMIYKVATRQLIGGRDSCISVLCSVFESRSNAIRAAKEAKRGDAFSAEVRAYDLAKSNIISFDHHDTGEVIFTIGDNIRRTPKIDKISVDDVVNFLRHDASDEEFAEVFVKYFILRNSPISIVSEELALQAKDMRIDIDALVNHIKGSLNEIIYSDEIDESAWWKQKNHD